MPSSSPGSSSGPSGWSDHDRPDQPEQPDTPGRPDEGGSAEPADHRPVDHRPADHAPPATGGDQPPEHTSSETAGSARDDPWAAGKLAGYPAVGAAPHRKGPGVRREAAEGVVVALALAVLGVVLGALWTWLAPKVPLQVTQDAIYLKDSEGEETVGADGTFTLLALAAGALTGAAVFWLRRRGGIGVVFGLVAGGLLASLVAWKLGVAWGPTDDVVAHAREMEPGTVFDGPLELRAKSALLAWPTAAVLVHLLHVALFAPRDEQPPPGW